MKKQTLKKNFFQEYYELIIIFKRENIFFFLNQLSFDTLNDVNEEITSIEIEMEYFEFQKQLINIYNKYRNNILKVIIYGTLKEEQEKIVKKIIPYKLLDIKR